MEYYIEYIFAENFLIDFILLYITGKLIKRKIVYKRLIVASILGAIYVILTAFIGKEFMTYFIVKFSVSILMIMVAYDSKSLITNIKVIICFYIVTIIMVGIITSLYYLTFDRLTVNIIILSMFTGYVALRIFFSEIKSRMNKSNYMRKVTIKLNNKIKTLTAFIDTGNELVDPITGKPVIIVNIECLSEMLGEEVKKEILDFYNDSEKNYRNLFLEKNSKLRIRVVKYNTISSEKEQMVCVVPDDITILSNDKNIINADAIIGIYPQKISKNEDYEALLFKKLLDWESDAVNEKAILF
ncbi:sigma-E processing peptidase SpoIIGA [Sedimentibacter sp. MB31-C6]|uniref:sigma-E processing peptidase SpoIIGA n=1 Tax=Sedimentibacter sp. MB31-C6 TaxID=3109366 RepID=UPI002DDCA6F6|nr:sigma-E processing peptidase SpoIIGA [Sedimentibacter sp. MB36-C1]WSI03822.1 sigma-E processing peptidase SpoIIGA [Sedimentibacter sp. MB36-C1]